MDSISRRGFFGAATGATAGAVVTGLGTGPEAAAAPSPGLPKYKLGMVTYNMGKDMDQDTLIKFCQETGLEGVELRSTHAHGVEPDISKSDRDAAKNRFADGGIEIVQLGTAHEFHKPGDRLQQRQIEGAKAFAQLAADVGASGIKLRPNGLIEGEPVEETCARIGKAWHEVAAFAADLGVETRMEVHGSETKVPKVMRMILDAADHPNAKINWNSNGGEEDEHGSIKKNFDLLKHRITHVHITEIGVYQYPWQELFDLLKEIDFSGYCMAEIGYNPEPERFMKHYRTLFDLYTGRYQYPQ